MLDFPWYNAIVVLLVGAVLFVNSLIFLAVLFAALRLRRALNDARDEARGAVSELRDTVTAFFASPDGQASPFGEMVDKIAVIFSSRLMGAAEARLRGSAGGAAKGANAAEQAEMLGPLAPMLTGKLGKSPLAILALSLLGKQLTGGHPGNNGNGNHSPSSNTGMAIR